MDDNTKLRKLALEDALCETDRLMDMFADVLSEREIGEYEKRNFSEAASKIMGLKVPEKTVIEHGTDGVKTTDERFDMDLKQLSVCAHDCKRCKLFSTRKNVVFGEGCDFRPDVMIIGEGPGETEDNLGRPFVGKAGQYLDTWLKPISLSRETNVYVTNIVKCRPPMNRDPQPDEKKACLAFVKQQISLVQPRAILCLGKPASTELTGLEDASMGSLRGRFFFYDTTYPMICTYHPAAVLRDQTLKRHVWEDLQKLAKFLNLPIVRK